jgi:hypothetical protein
MTDWLRVLPKARCATGAARGGPSRRIPHRAGVVSRRRRLSRRSPLAGRGRRRDHARHSNPHPVTKDTAMNALIAILDNTPTAVWAVLAALVLVGLRQTRTRTLSGGRVWLVPLVAGAASLAGALRGFAGAGELLTGACWAIGATLGFAANRSLDLPRRVVANADGSFTVGGSVAPLVLLVVIFLVRYATNVALAIQPALSNSPAAAAVVAIAYGLTAGLLVARSRKIWATRRTQRDLLAA